MPLKPVLSFDTDECKYKIARFILPSPSLAYHQAYKFFIVGFSDAGDNYPKIVRRQIDYTNLTTGNYVGVADAAYSDGALQLHRRLVLWMMLNRRCN